MEEKFDRRPSKILWCDRKHGLFGLPWTFTRYKLTAEKLIIETGFLNYRTDEVRLYRVRDVSCRQTLGERILGLGTIEVASSDDTMRNFEIKRVRHSKWVNEAISQLVEECRRNSRVLMRELLGDREEEEYI